MATRDLSPQDEPNGSNDPYVPDEDGAGVRGQTGDNQLDQHTEENDTVVPDGGVRASDSDSESADDEE